MVSSAVMTRQIFATPHIAAKSKNSCHNREHKGGRPAACLSGTYCIGGGPIKTPYCPFQLEQQYDTLTNKHDVDLLLCIDMLSLTSETRAA